MSKTTDGNIIEFLLGEKSFAGNWFGDPKPKDAREFWWRKYLRRYIEDLKNKPEVSVAKKLDEIIGVRVSELEEDIAFVKEASEHFSKNAHITSFGVIAPGERFALRWGLGDDCVLVLNLDEHKVSKVYHNTIKKEAR